MIVNKLLIPLTIIGLIAGCSAGTTSPRGAGPSSVPSPLPTQTIALETRAVPVNETPEIPDEQVTPSTLRPNESVQPPADKDHSPRSPVEGARRDLARRLRVDLVLVKVVETVTREPDVEMMPCLDDGAVSEELWAGMDEVQWITLSVKGQVHHYLVLDDFIVYCQM